MRVLIAEDDANSRRMMEMLFRRWGYDVSACADGLAAWHAACGPEPPPLAVLDWKMPGLDGLELCRRIRRRADAGYMYIILVSGRTEREHILEGLDAGADDYVRKPIDFDELEMRVRAAHRILDVQRALQSRGEQFRDRAARDSLTGLWNRGESLAILEREMERAARQGTTVGLIVLDIDHFKGVNDQHGHAAGDDVLRATSRQLLGLVRSYDAVGRYGGEEFVIVLPGCTAESACQMAERIRQTVGTSAPPIPGRAMPVTVSAGVAVSRAEPASGAAALFSAADRALYRAKAAGRNRVALAVEDDYRKVRSPDTHGPPQNDALTAS